MVTDRRADPQAAPGCLEEVRGLLNSWWIPNDTRRERDDLDRWLGHRDIGPEHRADLERLRGELRRAVEDPALIDDLAAAWIARHGVRPAVRDRAVGFEADGSPAADLVVAVLEALACGGMDRLKACPDCRWVFYDHTRNGAKRWCVMNATTPGARACGNIAKARRHRARSRRA